MKIFIFCFFISVFCFGQEDPNWYGFYNSDSTKIGFKDVKGNIKIEPKFQPAMMSQVFKNVIAVLEYAGNNRNEQYYLNKNGKKFGKDSVYIFDFEYAVESEGKIKFRDRKTDKVGFFDNTGKVVIPAIYNDAGDFHNGIAMIMKDGVRKCWKEDNGNQPEYPNCEHWSWEGKTMMINTKNQELFEIPEKYLNISIDYDNIYKNFKLNEKVSPDIYTSYKGNDGNMYSFYNSEKDFKKWFETVFLPNFKTYGKILEKYYADTVSWRNNEKEKNISKTVFLKNYDKKINTLIKEYLQKKYDIDFFDENTFKEPENNISINVQLTSKIEDHNPESAVKFHYENIVFKKIGDRFYITNAP